MSTRTPGPRKVLVGTSMYAMWHEYPGLERRLRELADLVGRMAAEAASRFGAARLDIAALPETAISGGLEGRAAAFPLEGAVLDVMGAAAREHGCYVVVPLYLAEDPAEERRSNAAVLLDRRGEVAGIYRKAFAVVDRGAATAEAGVTPGDSFPVFACDFGRVGIQICYDMAFDDGWEALGRKGAELIVWPTQWPGKIHPARRALEHRCFVLSSTWRNNASLTDPTGHTIHEMREEGVFVESIDLEYAILSWQPALRNGAAFDEAFGSRAGYRYSEEEDCGIFWSNDPALPIGEMVRMLDLEPREAELARVRERLLALRAGPPSRGGADQARRLRVPGPRPRAARANIPSEAEIAKRADELHARALVIDGHSDLLIPIADGWTRLAVDPPAYGQPAGQPPIALPDGSRKKNEWPWGGSSCIGQYSLPLLEAGGLTAEVFAIFVEEDRLDAALKRSLEMAWWFHKEMEDNRDRIEPVTRAADIRRLKAQGKRGAILALEGFEPLGVDLRLLDVFHRLGVRMGGLAHNRRSAWCDGTMYRVTDAGLTPLGAQAVKRMNELGIVVDVSHLTARGFSETLEIAAAPVVLSHRSPRKFFPLSPEESPFHAVYDLSRGRERLEALAGNGGVFGVFFLEAATVDEVVDDIEYVIDLVGPDHVGLGSDLYGRTRAPAGLEDISGVPAITRALVRRGHGDEVILKVLGENYLRVFEAVWEG